VPTFTVENFGCRATEADAAALRSGLQENGLTSAREHASADFVVLNTCTVTAAADSQAREAIRRIHRANPAARIIVTGCYAQRAPDEIAFLEGVSYVVGNSRQAEIPGLLRNLAVNFGEAAAQCIGTEAHVPRPDFVPLGEVDDAMSLASGPAKILTGDILAHTSVQIASPALMVGDRTRPILKVQDGCNNRCGYCVIPLVRGRSRSLAPQAVVDEVSALVASGAKEIVLSGINLGSYGRDLVLRVPLLDLVQNILDQTAVEQLRFSSIEPQDVTADFVAFVAGSSRVAPHFHVPLQSGCDRILRAMHRWYRAAHYAERIELIRRLLPDGAIGADVIVGFPGETDEDFAATAQFIERLPFTYLHVFPFSARPGTAAATLGANVPSPVIRERARSLRALAQQKSGAFRAAQAGRPHRALTLNRSGENWTEALTGNYLKLRIAGRRPANEWCEVRLAPDPLEILDAAACEVERRSLCRYPNVASSSTTRSF
jgi:threonylcarbamoyladenosine tRNA methylthiotransferase MtaB